MRTSLRTLGSVVIDVDDNIMDVRFINDVGLTDDAFTIEKGPPTPIPDPHPDPDPGPDPDPDPGVDPGPDGVPLPDPVGDIPADGIPGAGSSKSDSGAATDGSVGCGCTTSPGWSVLHLLRR